MGKFHLEQNHLHSTLNEIVKWPKTHSNGQLTMFWWWLFKVFTRIHPILWYIRNNHSICLITSSLYHNTSVLCKTHFVDIALLNETCRPSASLKHLTFTKKPNNPPYEVAAVMAEGRFGQGHFPKAVPGSADTVPRLWTRRLLRLFPPGSGARARAVALHPTAVCHLCQFQWKSSAKRQEKMLHEIGCCGSHICDLAVMLSPIESSLNKVNVSSLPLRCVIKSRKRSAMNQYNRISERSNQSAC